MRPVKLGVLYSPDPSEIGRTFELDAQPITLGRDPGATIVLRDDGASRRHARITKEGEAWVTKAGVLARGSPQRSGASPRERRASQGEPTEWVIHDEGSTHGTRINDVPVQTAVLTRGDELILGRTVLSFDVERIVETDGPGRAEDGLTGLPTLRTLREGLEAQLEGRPLALVRFDVAGLKAVNERHGYPAGDGLLKELARRLRRAAPPEAQLARVAGDAFALVLEGVGHDEARRIGEDLRARCCGEAFVVDDSYVRARLRVGIATSAQAVDARIDARASSSEPTLLIDAARRDAYARHRQPWGTRGPIEWAVGLSSRESGRTLDVAAACDGRVFAMADGDGGHATGWLGARLTVRSVLERLGRLEDACLVGAADLIPDAWGWAGAAQSQEAGEAVYAQCQEALRAPPHLVPLFQALDEVLRTVPPRARIQGLMVSATAVRVEGARVEGAHAGLGRIRVLRSGANHFEELVVPHYLHLVWERMTAMLGREPVAPIPERIFASGLGGLDPGVGVDAFETDLHPGDLLLMTSGDLSLSDGELIETLRREGPPRQQVSAIERRLDVLRATSPHDAPGDVAFVVLRCR